MHWRISMSSAESASAQEVQIAAQNNACRTASARGSLEGPASGWAAMIFAIDIAGLLAWANGGISLRFRNVLERKLPLL
jgi:hypothetical protein